MAPIARQLIGTRKVSDGVVEVLVKVRWQEEYGKYIAGLGPCDGIGPHEKEVRLTYEKFGDTWRR